MKRIDIAESADALSHAVGEAFARVASAAVEARGRCSVALAGGSTPKSIYLVLAGPPFRTAVPWDRIEFFWGDERHVPPDHVDSNYRMAEETLLSKLPVVPGQIHRMHGEVTDAAAAAQAYEDELRVSFGEHQGTPRFDLILLGLGTDGHTASLFPGTSALVEQQRLSVANWVDSLGVHRLTMTLPLINAARAVIFVVSGGGKAEIVRDVLRKAGASRPYPAQLVQPVDGDLLWMLDRDAARALEAAAS